MTPREQKRRQDATDTKIRNVAASLRAFLVDHPELAGWQAYCSENGQRATGVELAHQDDRAPLPDVLQAAVRDAFRAESLEQSAFFKVRRGDVDAPVLPRL